MVELPSGLRVGASVTIEMNTHEGTREFKSRVEDIAEGEIAIMMPTERGVPVLIPLNEFISVSTVLPSAAQLFIEGEVVGRRGEPVPMLVVKPLRYQMTQKRQSFRVQARIEPEALWRWVDTAAEAAQKAAEAEAAAAAAAAEPSGMPFTATFAPIATPIATPMTTPTAAPAVTPAAQSTPGGQGAAAPAANGGGQADPAAPVAGEGEQYWQALTGVIIDISGGGVGLLADQEAPVNSKLRIRFPLPTGEEDLDVAGTVVLARPRPMGQQTRYVLGLKFDELSAEEEERLLKANHHYQLEQRRKALGNDR